MAQTRDRRKIKIKILEAGNDSEVISSQASLAMKERFPKLTRNYRHPLSYRELYLFRYVFGSNIDCILPFGINNRMCPTIYLQATMLSIY